MRAVSPRAPFKFPDGVGGALIVEHDGHGEGVFDELAKSGELCTEAGAHEVVAAQDEAQRRRVWETRRMISVALTAIRPHKISEDVAVPRGRLIELIGRVRAIGERFGLPTACYGHAGDGNLHVNLLFESQEERARGHAASPLRRSRGLTDSPAIASWWSAPSTAMARPLPCSSSATSASSTGWRCE